MSSKSGIGLPADALLMRVGYAATRAARAPQARRKEDERIMRFEQDTRRRPCRDRAGSAAMFGAIMLLAACSPSGPQEPENGLRSDMPLRTTVYLVDHPQELAELKTICDRWKGSQQPPMSWPSVVVQNCNSSDAARTSLMNRAENEKLMRAGRE